MAIILGNTIAIFGISKTCSSSGAYQKTSRAFDKYE